MDLYLQLVDENLVANLTAAKQLIGKHNYEFTEEDRAILSKINCIISWEYPENDITEVASISIVKEEDKIIVCFDTGKKTFRHEKFSDYKGQRKETDDDLKIQIPLARDLLKAMGIFYYEQEGYEADDIAGSISKMASRLGIDTYCYTSDKDYLQLIDDHITITMIRKGLTDIEDMTEEKLKEKMGLTPDQIRDYKGLNNYGTNGVIECQKSNRQ